MLTTKTNPANIALPLVTSKTVSFIFTYIYTHYLPVFSFRTLYSCNSFLTYKAIHILLSPDIRVTINTNNERMCIR